MAESLLAKVEEDRDTLRQLADKIGSGPNVLKEFTAWASEKAGRIKLGAASADDFGEFEALEFLALGITGKLSLWLALEVVARSDARLRDIDFERLIARAKAQYKEVEEQRLALVSTALATARVLAALGRLFAISKNLSEYSSATGVSTRGPCNRIYECNSVPKSSPEAVRYREKEIEIQRTRANSLLSLRVGGYTLLVRLLRLKPSTEA